MKAPGPKTEPMEKASIWTRLDNHTRDNGKTTNLTVLEWWNFPMGPRMKAVSYRAWNMVKGRIHGRTRIPFTRENGLMIWFREEDSFTFQMGGSITGISKTECFTEMAFIYGQTGPSTLVSSISTRSMVEVLMNGAIKESSKGTGIVDSDKVKECIH